MTGRADDAAGGRAGVDTDAVLVAADELYALLPDAFTAARDARAAQLRADGDRPTAAAVKALRRPSVAAWLVNALVRHAGDEVERLLGLGDALREAQAGLDGDELRALNRQRQGVVAAMGRQARALARELGRPITEPVADEVEATLTAALSDPAAASAVRTGRLTGALHYAGFGETDVSGAVAAGGAPRRPAPPRGDHARTPSADVPPDTEEDAEQAVARAARREAVAQAREALRDAMRAADRARGAQRTAEQHAVSVARRAEVARERHEAAQARVAELETVLADARRTAGTALATADAGRVEADEAKAAADRAAGTAAEALAALDAAKERVTALEDGDGSVVSAR